MLFEEIDYDLDLVGRKKKFNNSYVLCKKCYQSMGHDVYYCKYCYDKETDEKERNRMLYGKCKRCFETRTKHGWCSSCIVFKPSDYDLDWGERYRKFKGYKNILCGNRKCDQKLYSENRKCNQKFYSGNRKCNQTFYKSYCKRCYDKEANKEERNRMLYGKCKRCFTIRTERNWCSSCNIVFKPSDYDLDLEERYRKFKGYKNILCGNQECQKLLKGNLFYCKRCYDKETDEKEKNRMLYGKCKYCFRIQTKKHCCIVLDYDLNLDEREKIFNYYGNIFCEKCNQKLDDNLLYCEYCYDKETSNEKRNIIQHGRCKKCFQTFIEYIRFCLPCRFKQDFNKWTSGNENIDELIQNNQMFDYYSILEWIPYNRFSDIKYMAKGGFAKVYSATWIDGYIKDYCKEFNNWKREELVKVALKVLDNSSDHISEDFLNEIKGLKAFPHVNLNIVRFYGITRDPTTNNYALVFKLEDSDLRSYLYQNCNLLTLEKKLRIIKCICSGLSSIHGYGFIHKDLHLGNILHSTLNNQSIAYISDFGFCKPANENSSRRIYGIMPYMAPEILRYKPYTKQSDIYSLGIIINEIISTTPPFNGRLYDSKLALDICRDRRPKISEETPEPLKQLIEKCWDAIPENRPSSDKVEALINDFINDTKYEEFIKKYPKQIDSLEPQLFKTRSQTIYTNSQFTLSNSSEPVHSQTTTYTSSQLITLPNLPRPIHSQTINTNSQLTLSSSPEPVHSQTTYTSSQLITLPNLPEPVHSQTIYTSSQLIILPDLPEPVNCQNHEEFVSSTIINSN